MLVLVCVLIYFGIRGLTEGSETTAIRHGHDLLRLERDLGVQLENDLQRFVLDRQWLMTAFNWVYIWGHWPVIAITLTWLHHGHRRAYLILRNAMIVSGAIGLVIFVSYPVAPPRLLPTGFVDTVTENSRAYRVLQPPGLVNKYAAMPSLHAGWNLLVGISLWGASRRPLVRAFAVVGPALMAVAVVATANHYVLDPVVGAIVVLVGLAVSRVIWEPIYARRWKGARSTEGSLAAAGAHRFDQPEVVDDQAVDAPLDELRSTDGILDAPGEHHPLAAQVADPARRQQPLVHRNPVVPLPPG